MTLEILAVSNKGGSAIALLLCTDQNTLPGLLRLLWVHVLVEWHYL